MMEKNYNSFTKDEISTFLNLLVIKATCPKVYKKITTNSFEILFVHDYFKV